MPRPVLGLVLAGGQSLRMGQDKALLKPWGTKGPTLLERSFQLLSSLTPACFVSCAKNSSYAGFPCLEDAGTRRGPAQGILVGLLKARQLGLGGALAMACDLANMRADIMARILETHGRADVFATLYASEATGTVEMLAGVYSVAFIPALQKAIACGETSLYRILPAARRQLVRYGPQLEWAFANCNRPEDLPNIEKTD